MALGLILTVCGCSSGGGGQKAPSTDISIAPPESNRDLSQPPWNSFAEQIQDPVNLDELASQFETDEYAGMGALAVINASSAYARGATGAGVKVGMIDSGVYREHIEFAQGTGDKVEYAGSDYSTSNPRTDSAISHGTLVAGVIAANKDDSATSTGINMHGVAFDATLLAYEIPLGSGEAPYDPIDVEQITFGDDNYFANRFTTMADQVDIINLSFGFPGVITSYSTTQIESAFSLSLDALRQSNRSRGERSIFVISAGNAWNDVDDLGNTVQADSPELLPGLPYLFPELKDHVLAVVAVDNSGEIAFYSNRCGVAADFCLAAPGGGDGNNNGTVEIGERIWGPTPPEPEAEANTHYYAGAIGTSFAAPVVSGSLALLKQMFPTVGNHELVERLLKTANKAGIYSDSSIYGQGLLDLDAATRPVGALAVASNGDLNSGLNNLSASTINTSESGLGTSLLSALKGHQIALFDQLGFPFYTDARRLVNQTRSPPEYAQLQHREQRLSNGGKLQIGQTNPVADNAYFSLQPAYLTLQLGNQLGDQLGDQSGIGRFVGINANPGWFFGVYADNFIAPASSADRLSFAAPWLRFARNGWSSGGGMVLGLGKLRAGIFNGSAADDLQSLTRPRNSHGGLLEYALLSTNFSVNFQHGFISENSSLLGATLGQTLGQLKNTATKFFGLNGHLQLSPKWRGIFAVYHGTTESGLAESGLAESGLAESKGLLNLDKSLKSSAWSVGINSTPEWQAEDRLSIYLHQPLRIAGGQGSLRLATGRSVDRQVSYETVAFDLEPQGREQQLEVRYQFKWNNIITAARVEYTIQPNHSPLNPHYGVIEFSLFRAFKD